MRAEDEEQGNLSHRQFTSFRCELRALAILFPGKTVADLTANALAEFFRRGQASKKTYNNRRGACSVPSSSIARSRIGSRPVPSPRAAQAFPHQETLIGGGSCLSAISR